MKELKKLITEFDETEYGYFLSTKDEDASVVVDKDNGDIFLDEGYGSNTYQGAFLSKKSSKKFTIEENNIGSYNVFIDFSNIHHRVGTTSNIKELQHWVKKCNELISRKDN